MASAHKNNIAFKYNYNDGSKSRDSFGFRGRCSKNVIKFNTSQSGKWCSHKRNTCYQFHNNFIDTADEYPCTESRLLIDWEANAEYDTTGDKHIPRRIPNTDVLSNIAVLTTIQPNMKERDRVIFGIFLIDKHFIGDDNLPGYVKSNETLRLELKPSEPLYFWKYHRNENKSDDCKWGQGLYRYLDDIEVCQMLYDVANMKKDDAEKLVAENLLKIACDHAGLEPTKIPKPNGAREW